MAPVESVSTAGPALTVEPDRPPELVVIFVKHLEDAAVVRSLTLRRGLQLGLTSARAAEAALVASELATNMFKYATDGELILSHDLRQDALWIYARDRGAGPPPAEQLFEDGVSRGRRCEPHDRSSTGLGSGGAAIRRFSDEVEVSERLGGGTEIRCSIYIQRHQSQPQRG